MRHHINPIALEPAIAPHIAAEEIGQRLSAARLAGFYRGLMTNSPNFSLVEGAGGWRVPINNQENFSDFAKLIKLPVILVVGMDLGCINHAILTAEAIRKDNLVLAGWIANKIVPMMNRYKENITTIGSQTVSATGNIISNNITAASATTKMGAIITYQDH